MAHEVSVYFLARMQILSSEICTSGVYASSAILVGRTATNPAKTMCLLKTTRICASMLEVLRVSLQVSVHANQH